MGVIELILLIIRVGTALVPLISEIWDLITKVRNPADKAAFTADLNGAIETYKKTKDRRPLRELRDRLYAHCDGDCPPPLKAA